MKKVLIIGVIGFVFALSTGGCGGGGGGLQSPLRDRYLLLMSAINSENLSQTMSHYSLSYMHDCSTWQDVQSGWSAVFSEPDYALTLSNLVVVSEVVNNQTRDGLLIGSVTITEDIGGVITSETLDINMPFKKEGSSWRLFGNQTCASSASSWREAVLTYLGAKRPDPSGNVFGSAEAVVGRKESSR